MTNPRQFFGIITKVTRRDTMAELRCKYAQQPTWIWVAVKLFQESFSHIKGNIASVPDPFNFDRSDISWKNTPNMERLDTIEVNAVDKADVEQPVDTETGEIYIDRVSGKKVTKITFNLNKLEEIRVVVNPHPPTKTPSHRPTESDIPDAG